jgi:hypothetical protein
MNFSIFFIKIFFHSHNKFLIENTHFLQNKKEIHEIFLLKNIYSFSF